MEPRSGSRSAFRVARGEPLPVLRAAGLLAWAVSVSLYFGAAAATPHGPWWAALSALAFLLFAWAFWRATERVEHGALRVGTVGLLLLQTVIAFGTTTDLLFLVAAELPLVIAGSAAWAWLGGVLWTTGGLCLLGAAVGDLEIPPGLEHLPYWLQSVLAAAQVLGWQVFAFAAGYFAASAARRRDALQRAHAELQATQELLSDHTRLAERLTIARELHDTVGHHLAGLSLQLELAKRLAASPDGLAAPAGAGEGARPTDGAVRERRILRAVLDAQRVARLLLADVRDVVSTLRGDPPSDLAGALYALAQPTSEPSVVVDLPAELPALAPAQAHALLRSAQEAITNAVRHAGARIVRVRLTVADGALELTVRDDGRGMAARAAIADAARGHGLAGMRERLVALGGSLVIDSQPGRGVTVVASLPLPGAGAAASAMGAHP